MTPSAHSEMTTCLRRWHHGQGDAAAVVFDLVYSELQRSAAGMFRGERIDHTLQPTALVHEAYIRLVAGGSTTWHSPRHFLRGVARVMRQILVDHSRERGALKRGGDLQRVDLPDGLVGRSPDRDQSIALGQALERLEARDPLPARVVKARFFDGLSIDETAESLGVSTASVNRYWRRARAWLHAELDAPSA